MILPFNGMAVIVSSIFLTCAVYGNARANSDVQELRTQTAYKHAEQVAPRILRQWYAGGTNLTWDLNDFTYNKYKDEYIIDLSMDWCGKIAGKCVYEADGELRIIPGRKPVWKASYHSEELDSFLKVKRYIGIAAGAAVMIDNYLGEEQP